MQFLVANVGDHGRKQFFNKSSSIVRLKYKSWSTLVNNLHELQNGDWGFSKNVTVETLNEWNSNRLQCQPLDEKSPETKSTDDWENCLRTTLPMSIYKQSEKWPLSVFVHKWMAMKIPWRSQLVITFAVNNHEGIIIHGWRRAEKNRVLRKYEKIAEIFAGIPLTFTESV